LILCLLLSSCATGAGRVGEGSVPSVIRSDTTISGTVHIKGTVKVLSGATLTIAPGAKLLFEPYDPDKDGVNDSGLVVEGGFVARGEPDAPIIFTSAAARPEPGDWLEIRIEKAEGVVLQYCVLEYARNGLHAHFCSGVIADSIFRRNIDASHFSAGRFNVWNNRFAENIGSGLSFRDSTLSIEDNLFVANRSGIFVFENDSGSLAGWNLFEGNSLADVRFGDFFIGDTGRLLDENFSEDGKAIKVILPGGKEEAGETRSPTPEAMSGPIRRSASIAPLWTSPVGSFLDASPARAGAGRIAVPTWGGDLIQYDLHSGRELLRTRIGEVMDASPVYRDGLLVFPAWDRKVRAVEATTGKTVWEWEWTASPQDDHRQASPAFLRGEGDGLQVVQGLWNGEVVSLDPQTGRVFWKTVLDGAVRCSGSQLRDGEFWVGTDAGTLYRIDPAGRVLGRRGFPGAVRAGLQVSPGERVAVADWSGSLSLMDLTGNLVWSRKVASQGTYASPIPIGKSFPDNFVLAGNGDGRLLFLDGGKGATLWERTLGSPVHVTEWLDRRTVFVGLEDGTALLLDQWTGLTLAGMKTGGAIHGAPLFDGATRTLVFGSRDGILRACRVEVAETPWEGPK
jgi:outer membrane protein assembly factor BamB